MKPSPNTHIDLVRQSNGSYTAFEVTDASPYRAIATTEHFERRFSECQPHRIPAAPSTTLPPANPPGAGSQWQVSTALGGTGFGTARISDDHFTILFDSFDSRHSFINEWSFSPPTFSPPFNYRYLFLSLAFADLNRDGNPDLVAFYEKPVAASVHSGGAWVFLGRSDGTFDALSPKDLFSKGGNVLPALSFSLADVNRDGLTDLALVRTATGTLVSLGKGDGTFGDAVSDTDLAIGSLLDPTFSTLADLNGDGNRDLVAAVGFAGQPSAAVALGKGDGSFQKAVNFGALLVSGPAQPIVRPSSFAQIAVGDLNGDGIPDLASFGGSILFGDGKGGFPSRADYLIDNAASVMIADFDGDGNNDVIFGNGNPTFLSGNSINPGLTVLFGEGRGRFAGAPALDSADVLSALVAFADFDSDGFIDMVRFRGLNQSSASTAIVEIQVLKGSSDPAKFLPMGTARSIRGYVSGALSVADFNGDGKPDLAFTIRRTEGDAAVVMLATGAGTFGDPHYVPVSEDAFGAILTPDLNGDSAPDLVIQGRTGVTVLLNKGDATFSAGVFRLPARDPAIGFADLNGDGKVDLAIVDSGSTVLRVFNGAGDGTFRDPREILLRSAAAGFANGLAAADFDGDGRTDLAVTLADDGRGSAGVAILRTGVRWVISMSEVLPGVYGSVAVFDVNKDNIPDLFLGSKSTSSPAAVCRGDGRGFQACEAVAGAGAAIYIGDLDTDGMPDVIRFGGGLYSVLLNVTGSAPALTVVSAATFGPGAVAPGTIVAAFGKALFTGPDVGISPPLTSPYDGKVLVQDSAGVTRSAAIYFLSATQINFVIPRGVAAGPATVTVIDAAGDVLSSQITVKPISPVLFTVGSAIAAAYTVKTDPFNVSGPVLVYSVQGGAIVPEPIDVTTGMTYLVLFGTGFDAASVAATAVTVQGVPVAVAYSGVQSSFPGLDQINVTLPKSLAGTGPASIFVTVSGIAANVARVTIR